MALTVFMASLKSPWRAWASATPRKPSARYARKLAANGGETYVVTNNHFGGKAVANGLDLLAGLRGEPPAASPEIVAAFPHLAGKVRVFGQGSLF